MITSDPGTQKHNLFYESRIITSSTDSTPHDILNLKGKECQGDAITLSEHFYLIQNNIIVFSSAAHISNDVVSFQIEPGCHVFIDQPSDFFNLFTNNKLSNAK